MRMSVMSDHSSFDTEYDLGSSKNHHQKVHSLKDDGHKVLHPVNSPFCDTLEHNF